jgi:hypothetical protein
MRLVVFECCGHAFGGLSSVYIVSLQYYGSSNLYSVFVFVRSLLTPHSTHYPVNVLPV